MLNILTLGNGAFNTKLKQNVINLTYSFLAVFEGDECMRISCHKCGSKSVIYGRTELASNFFQLYCICKNPQCSEKFVMDLNFSHSISEGYNKPAVDVLSLLKSLPRHQLEMLMAGA